MKQTALSLPALRGVVESMSDDGLRPAREAALRSLDTRGLPTLRDEDWKYTDLSSAIAISNQWLKNGAPAASDDLQGSIDEITAAVAANWLIVANGVIDDTRFTPGDAIDVERFSATTAPIVADRALADLNVALLQDGLRIRVHATPERPLGILVIDSANDAAAVSQANIEICVSDNCSAEIVEYHASVGEGDHYANTIVSLDTGYRSQVGYTRIQNRRIGHVFTGRISAALGTDSTLDMANYDIGGGLVRNDVDINLAATGAAANFNGLYLVGDNQHIDNHTSVEHRVGPAVSSQEYRGILNGSCRAVWNGKAIVFEGADGTDATQANHNLLLSERSEIDAKPELEIYAEDVKCAHGTTVGQLDETALFYLQSRGIDKMQGRQMLTHAFAVDLVSRTPVDATRDAVNALVSARLEELIRVQAQ
ncbi:MAG: Fe-S cluster assembly protein SufD [Gammaproteobacteria bacterium]|nr:Fe-S cluster assembly protein SufD [Gammaproteobacteria bacterium]